MDVLDTDPGDHAGSQTVLIRPLEPADERLYPDFLARVSAQDRRFRFFSAAELTRTQIWAFTHYDPSRAVALVAEDVRTGGIDGVARLHRLDGADRKGEFAILVRSDLKGRGIGRALMEEICARAPSIGVETVHGLILSDNVGMLAFAREVGFELSPEPGDPGLVRAQARMDAVALPS